MKIQGNHFLVTGGASGLGAATVDLLAAKGAQVTILDRDLDAAAAKAKAIGGACQALPLDLGASDADIAAAIGKVRRPVHGLVNCAGVGTAQKVLSKRKTPINMEGVRQCIGINLLGNFSVASQVAKIMAENCDEAAKKSDSECGVIINTASVAAFDGQNGQCAYAASKGGLVALTLPMARDLGDFNIRVNTIAPGVFSTPMTGNGATAGELVKAMAYPHRVGNSPEFAHLAAAIIENGMMNGEVIRCDGGIRMPKL
jgi:NAD(P)-dependent dehydrogenase (short-subunit alcohol dehydrogenase family)